MLQPEPRLVRLPTGVVLACASSGDPGGVPVLLLHAWGESRRSFDRLVAALPDSVPVLTVDQRGHGDADTPRDAGFALADFAGDVTALLDASGIASAVLVGSSSGGYVAQQVAASAPDRVRGLVLLGAPRTLQGRSALADELEVLTDPVDPAWVRDSLAWFPRIASVPQWYVEDRVRDGVRLTARAWRQTFAGLVEAEPPTDHTTITCPTLVVWGEQDRLLTRDEQDALVAAIPRSRLIVYPDTGHLVLWERPDRVAADLTRFLAALGPAR